MVNPTPGPWTITYNVGQRRVRVVSGHIGIATIHALIHQEENALLIAAAGTAAYSVGHLGYDPIKAVQALPAMICSFAAIARGDIEAVAEARDILSRIKDTDNA